MIRKIFFVSLIVVIMGIITFNVYTAQLEQFSTTADRLTRDVVRYVEPSLLLMDHVVLHGEARLASDGVLDNPLYPDIVHDDATDTYNMDAWGQSAPDGTSANLTGIGPIPDEGLLRKEINMALDFNRYFHNYGMSISDIAWMYYTSENHFINIYPWVSSHDFQYARELHSVDFYTIATPANDPDRRKVWSPIYLDAAGKGLVVTLSKPIYHEDRFMGVASIDLTSALLANLIDSEYDCYLYDVSETLLASNTPGGVTEIRQLQDTLDLQESRLISLRALPQNRTMLWQSRIVRKQAITGAPWELLVVYPGIKVAGDVMTVTIPILIIGIFLMLFMNQTVRRKRSEQEYAAAVKTTQDAFWLMGEDGRFLRVNDAACSLYGYTEEEYTRMNVRDVLAAERRPAFLQRLHAARSTGADRFETQHVRKDGSVIHVEVSLTYLPDNHMFCLINKDITARRKQEEQIHFLSYHDALTGLYNRAYFTEEFQRLDDTSLQPVSLLIGDVNGLKLTNDVFGHAYGDRLLCCIADVLRKQAGKDDIVSRIGGDEFCILMPGTSPEGAQAVLDAIYAEATTSPCMQDGPMHAMSISIGYATRTAPGHPMSEVFQDAENMMYRRKLSESRQVHSLMLASLEETMAAKLPDYQIHSEHITKLALDIGRTLGLDGEALSDLVKVSRMHDIGKVSTDSRILDKLDPLTEEEWAEVKKHPEIGYRIAKALPEYKTLADSILYHHERWDGLGYPQGLSREDIPLPARIVFAAASYEALMSDRMDRKARTKEEALRMMQAESGKKYDPEVIAALVEVLKKAP